MPEGVQAIAVPVFINGTNEPYVDVEVTQAVVEEFMTDGRLKVVNLEEAELALRGKVKTYEISPCRTMFTTARPTFSNTGCVSWWRPGSRT